MKTKLWNVTKPSSGTGFVQVMAKSAVQAIAIVKRDQEALARLKATRITRLRADPADKMPRI